MCSVLRLVFATLLLAALIACGADADDSAPEGDRFSVIASTSIIAALAREVAGDQAAISSLTGPGSDPHLYEPSPGDIRAVSDADLILINGLGLDDHLLDDIESANPDSPTAVVSEGIDLIDGDPHVWQDPLRVKVMIDKIAAALSQADPGNSAAYRDAAAAYRVTLDETHEQIKALIARIPPESRKIVTNHDSFGYFAARYGLEVVATVIPGLSTEADPSAAQIADLIDLIERESVNAIFAEEIANTAIAEQVADDTGTQIVTGLYTDQVGEDGSGAESVHGMLLANAEKISEALG